MAGNTEPRSGLYALDDLVSGESGWAAYIIGNNLALARLAYPNLHVLDRDLATPPGSPAAGDAYIPAATATGDWAGHEDDIAIWDGASWVFYTPSIGWMAYIEDEEKITAYKATGWSAGVAV